MSYSIYFLTCPLDGKIKYIGSTSDKLVCRRNAHVYSVKGKVINLTNKDMWINSLVENGLRPDIHLFDLIDDYGHARELEDLYMDYLNELGCSLFNVKRNFRNCGTITAFSYGYLRSIGEKETKKRMISGELPFLIIDKVRHVNLSLYHKNLKTKHYNAFIEKLTKFINIKPKPHA